MYSFLKRLTGIAVTFALLLSYAIPSFADKINSNIFEKCSKVTDNTYRCKLNKTTDAAKIKSYSCHGNNCTLQLAPKGGSKQNKGTTIYGFNNMPYTLCSKSECTIDKKNPTMAFCKCPIINTKNQISSISISPFNREKTLPTYDAAGNMIKVTSDFSLTNVFDFKNSSKIYDNITLCTYKKEHSFADCFGVSCKVDKQNTLQAQCYCPIRKTKSFVSIVGQCNTEPDKVYSAVSLDQFQLEGIYTLYRHFQSR